jgi:shikimate dehydrogenase
MASSGFLLQTARRMISGTTSLVAHIGYPTHAFKAPLIYNPWFEARGIDAVVVPMGAQADVYPALLRALFGLSNIRGALITMPHKVTTVSLVDRVSTTAAIAGACNAVKRDDDGVLAGDMFDGTGFVRGVLRKGVQVAGARCLVVGAGGVGSAIAASLAHAGAARIGLHDVAHATMEQLAARLEAHYPALDVPLGGNDPAGYDVVVNCTPLGMHPGDPLPLDVERLSPSTFVGEVVMARHITPFLEAARARGCRIQPGLDMLYEMIPAYLEFFGFGTATADELRATAQVA